MRRFFGSILAIPFKLLFAVMSLVPAINTVFLCKIIWKLSQSKQYSERLIALTYTKQGRQRAGEIAEKVLEKHHHSQAAVMMSLFELSMHNDVGRGEYWVSRAEGLDCEDQHLLLLPKIILADHLEKYDIVSLVEEVLSRDDLSAIYSRTAILVKSELFLRLQQWQDARRCIEPIATIEGPVAAWFILWVVSMAEGDIDQAERLMKQVPGGANQGEVQLHIALGYYYLCDLEKTKEHLLLAISLQITSGRIRMINPELWELAAYEGMISDDTEEAA